MSTVDTPPSRTPGDWGVTALLLAANDLLAARFGAVTVSGEIAGFTRAGSGHCYFTLREPGASGNAAASLRCAMFRRHAMLLAFAPRDGQQVRVRGRVAVYEARGELQLVVESLQAVGEGALYEQFLRLKTRLAAQGLFDDARKRPLAPVPRAIGVITSPGAAAWHDVMVLLARRAPHVPVLLYPSAVQGAQAPAELVRALALANQRDEVQTLILCRGGGSMEDLWAFNDEQLVAAVAASRLPVVCGVGHETDITLAELAADRRAATPTAAAELAAASRDELLARQQALADALVRRLRQRLDAQQQRLDRLGLRLGQPSQRLQRQREAALQREGRLRRAAANRLDALAHRLQRLADRLPAAARQRAQQARAQQIALGLRLAALDPAQVLSRGYAWVRTPEGAAVCSAAGVQPGMRLQTVWADGVGDVVVQAVHVKPDPRMD